ncbi:hypothetical protein BDR26DRAFT_931388 [Obelidium mucronatum]|nr:hypothetical protein BDR26DRAFT_931388 [Obelidium mucronatum]
MFSPEQVKTLARAHGLVPLSHSEDLGAISFKYPGLPWRIAVFYTTQTAVVSISDAAGNSSKQAIRDSISLSDLENLFQHPKTNGLVAVTGSCFRQSPPPLPEKQKQGKNRRGWDPTESLTVENDLNDKAIEAAMREHLQDLQGQVLGCQETLEKFQERRRKQEAEEMRRASKFLLRTISAEKSRKNTIQEDVGRFDRKSSEISIDKQGVAFDYSLVYSNGLPRRLSEVRCVAISPEGGFAVVSKTGACVYHKVPPQLSALLDQNEKAGH